MIKNLTLTMIFGLIFIFQCLSAKGAMSDNFVKVSNTLFEINGERYTYLGTNFWYGLNLGSGGPGGDRNRLIRELDRLKLMGINNLRIQAGSEGPDTEPYRMLPSLQRSPGDYNVEVLEGLDFLLNEMRKRQMYAIMCLNNFWNWSGGMAQYLVWSGVVTTIPYPPPAINGNWSQYQQFTSQFYSNQRAMEIFNAHIRFIVNHTNTYTKVVYKNDPTIMAWELANEPRGGINKEDYFNWINSTSMLIKNLDPNHLVTIGSEGATSSLSSGTNFERDHSFVSIDYTTIHIWVQNWDIYKPNDATETYPKAIEFARKYIDDHEKIAKNLNKPLVLEEFGISRDQNSHDPQSTTTIRDKYYTEIFDYVYSKAVNGGIVAGCNFWAWAGEGRPRINEGLWKLNDSFIGDPPHETQGWYSVYDTDLYTREIIEKYATKMNGVGLIYDGPRQTLLIAIYTMLSLLVKII
ncbi:unnamed protein product [Didymodactylos carnosus]|uniref:mannan endo-1,4-beta-mannosidase n=1 Tax=Didymodactylos carnosus TaxID=1234261 RepID=A0A814F2A4_9BILA|nr:unnamed protein product [Didymodactylos carnosus]CAF3747819.1 unnamed protein product [Didymodactylos carnosus]